MTSTYSRTDQTLNENDSKQTALLVCVAVTFSLAIAFLIMRIYTRRAIRSALGPEDLVITLAVVSAAAFSGCVIAQTVFGLGRHVVYIDSENLRKIRINGWLTILLYPISLSFTKLSTALLYLRIFSVAFWRKLAWVLLITVALASTLNIGVAAGICKPINMLWDPHVHGVCIPGEWIKAAIGTHVTTDILIMIFPLPVIITLKTGGKQKIALALIFGVGLLVVIVSILRSYYFLRKSSDDFTWEIEATFWTVVEVNVAIICPCAMTLKPLVARFVPRFASSDGSTPARRTQSKPWLAQNSSSIKGSSFKHRRRLGSRSRSDVNSITIENDSDAMLLDNVHPISAASISIADPQSDGFRVAHK